MNYIVFALCCGVLLAILFMTGGCATPYGESECMVKSEFYCINPR